MPLLTHTLSRSGGGDWSLVKEGGAIVLRDGVERISVEGCVFYRVGGDAVTVFNRARAVRFLSNTFEDVGGSGIILMGNGWVPLSWITRFFISI